MRDSSTAEIETKEEKPIETPLRDTDSIQGTTYDKKVSEWIDHINKKDNNQPEENSA